MEKKKQKFTIIYFSKNISQFLLAFQPVFCYHTTVVYVYYELSGGAVMAKCDICGKGAHFGNNVSHSNRKTNRIWKPNIKRVKCKVNGAPRRLHVCTNCLKSGKVERA